MEKILNDINIKIRFNPNFIQYGKGFESGFEWLPDKDSNLD